MIEKKNSDSNKFPFKQPLKPSIYVVITVVGLIFTMGGVIYILKAHDFVGQGIDKHVFFVLLFPLGFSTAAFLFGAMKGYAGYSGKVFKGKLELVGPVVAFFLVIVLGFYLIPKTAPFTYTFYLINNQERNVFKKDQALLRLFLDNNPVTSKSDDNGAIDFKGIPAKFQGNTVSLELDAKGWIFDNGKSSTSCKLNSNFSRLKVKRDDSLSKISGLITDEKGNFIVGVNVSTRGIKVFTDKNGWFFLEIPPNLQEEKLMLTIKKDGYKNKLEYAYPGNKNNMQVILEREE